MKTDKKHEPINIYLPEQYLIPSIFAGMLIGVIGFGLVLS
jgi:hypothetical protein